MVELWWRSGTIGSRDNETRISGTEIMRSERGRRIVFWSNKLVARRLDEGIRGRVEGINLEAEDNSDRRFGRSEVTRSERRTEAHIHDAMDTSAKEVTSRG